MAAGFSGSIENGRYLVSDLECTLQCNAGPGEAAIPRFWALAWYRRARWLFEGATRCRPREKKKELQIILFGASPHENILGSFSRTDVIVMSTSQGFFPNFAAPNECVGIGSGQAVEDCRHALAELTEDPFQLMQFEIGNPGGMGAALATGLALKVAEHRRTDVSRHLHSIQVSRGLIAEAPHQDWLAGGRNRTAQWRGVKTPHSHRLAGGRNRTAPWLG